MLNKNQKTIFIKAAKMLVISVFVLAAFLVIKPVLAATLDLGLEYAAGTGLATFDLRLMIARIIRIFLGFVGVIMVLIILYAGYLYMVSAGDKEKTLKARKTIISAVIGLIIILSAYSIASFIIRSLIDATTGRSYVGGEPYGSAGGALGGGIIESHYPTRNAVDIPRNTSIVVTFKEAMKADTLCLDSNTDNIFCNCNADGVCDQINATNIKIRKTADSATNGPFVSAVRALTVDNKTFVFKPLEYLGSEAEKMEYEVLLGPGLQKATGQGAFGNFGSYSWQFQVGTIIDLVPPKITSVIPLPQNDSAKTVAKNSVVQINFDEPINPITLMGVTKTSGGVVGDLVAGSFNYIKIKYVEGGKDVFVAGVYTPANQYKAVEFVTSDPCGINSCGEAVYCLPGNKNLIAQALAATLDDPTKPTAVFPYTGIVDMADNSLDGNSNDKADGPASDFNLNNATAAGGDNVRWSFYTNDSIDLVPPLLVGYVPAAGSLGANPRATMNATFTKLMMSSSIKPDSSYGDGSCPCTSNANCASGETCSPTKGYCVNDKLERVVCTNDNACKGANSVCKQKEHATLVQPASVPPRGYWLSSDNIDDNTKTILKMDHSQLAKNSLYSIRLGSGLRDLWQNCFQPAGGPGCVPKLISPGQYEAGSDWTIDSTGKVTFPSCDLTNMDITSFGSLILSYDSSGKNKIQTFSSFSSVSKDAIAFYNFTGASSQINLWGDPFNNMLAAKRTVLFVYHNAGNYYLIIINNILGVESGSAEFSFEGMPANAGIIFKDDANDSYPTDFQGSIKWNWAGNTDGMVVNLGPDTQVFTVTVKPGSFTNIDEIRFYYPGGYANLPKNKDFTISVGQ